MPTELQTLHADIAGEERAIRHLIGERAALNSKLKRQEALHKLNESKLKALTTKNHPAVSKSGPPLPHGERFPDFSSYQPSVDLAAIRHDSSIKVGDLAITKVSEGTGWADPYGASRLRGMAAAGFPHRGAYHFFHPSESASEQVDHFLDCVHADGVVIRDSDILICDCEVSDGESGATVAVAVKEFGLGVRKQSPARLWLYGGGPFLQEYGVTLDGYDAHWLAAYVGDPTPYMVFGRNHTVAWQYSDGVNGPTPHVCPGIGASDMSIVL